MLNISLPQFFAEGGQGIPLLLIFRRLVDEQEKIRLAAFQKAAGTLGFWLPAGGKKERKAFLRYRQRDAGFYLFQDFPHGCFAAGLLCQMVIQGPAVEKNHIGGGKQLLPADLIS